MWLFTLIMWYIMWPTFRRIRRRFWSGSVSGTRFLFRFGWFLSIQPWRTRTAKKKNCFISWLSENIGLMAFFTARIRRMREGNSFSLSTLVGGGVPHPRSGWGGGPVKDQDGGYPPHPRLDGVSPCPRLDGVPPISKVSTCYMAGSVPLALMQEDFLVHFSV